MMAGLAEKLQNDFGALESLYSVSLSGFEGPMDLLLHLAIRQELDISQVKMTEVVDQYLRIIEEYTHERLNIDELSEYLVIAAELLSLKSKSLLPKAEPEEGQPEVLQDFEELRERLRQYAICKKQAEAIREFPQEGLDFFSRRVSLDKREFRQNKFEVSSSFELAKSFAAMLKRVGGDLGRLKISLEPVSVVSFMMKAVDTLREAVGNRLNLFELVSKVCSSGESKVSAKTGAITMFFGALELAKRGVLSLHQETPEDSMEVSYRLDPENVVKLDNFR